MATRIEKRTECDFRLCRKRKGVRSLAVKIGHPGDPRDVTFGEYRGELCPYHFDQLLKNVERMFINTKTGSVIEEICKAEEVLAELKRKADRMQSGGDHRLLPN